MSLKKRIFLGFEQLEIVDIKSETSCFGRIEWIIDDLTEDDWQIDGFGDCSKGQDGLIEMTLADTSYVAYVKIYTPFTGREFVLFARTVSRVVPNLQIHHIQTRIPKVHCSQIPKNKFLIIRKRSSFGEKRRFH